MIVIAPFTLTSPRMDLPILAWTTDPRITESLGKIVSHQLFGFGPGVLQVVMTGRASPDGEIWVRLEVADIVGDYARHRVPDGRRSCVTQPFDRCDVRDMGLVETKR